jgi:hypothetical protein
LAATCGGLAFIGVKQGQIGGRLESGEGIEVNRMLLVGHHKTDSILLLSL